MKHINAYVAHDGRERCVGTFEFSEQGEFDARTACSQRRAELLKRGHDAHGIKSRLAFVDTEMLVDPKDPKSPVVEHDHPRGITQQEKA